LGRAYPQIDFEGAGSRGVIAGVTARSAIQLVIARSADQGVVASPGIDIVIAAIADEGIVAPAQLDQAIARNGGEGADIDPVIPGGAGKRIVVEAELFDAVQQRNRPA